MQSQIIYTDGSCLHNPRGPGGWAYVKVVDSKFVKEDFGHTLSTTNNRMEFFAVLEALKACADQSLVHVHSDSTLVIKTLSEWAYKWEKKGWIKRDGEPCKNVDLIKDCLTEIRRLKKVTFSWVPGHSGIPGNERCDYLATQAARRRMGNRTHRGMEDTPIPRPQLNMFSNTVKLKKNKKPSPESILLGIMQGA